MKVLASGKPQPGNMRRVRASTPPRLLAGGLAAIVAVTGLAATGNSAGASASPGGAGRGAAAAAQSWVATRPARLRVGPHDGFVQHPTITSAGWSYVPYDRTYRGLPVVGGDFVVVIDPAGRVRTASVAQQRPITAVALPASVTARAARRAAAGDNTKLVVYARSGPPRLAWEETNPASEDAATIYVDAATGAVLKRRSGIAYGSGNSARNGPNPVPIATTRVHFPLYDRYYLIDPSRNGITCGDETTHTPFRQSVDTWGNGDPRNHVTGCVDAMFAAQTQMRMLAQWLGRNGVDGAGHGFPMWMSTTQHKLQWAQNGSASYAVFGLNDDGRTLTSLDLVGHELGHGIDQFTPGGPSGKGTPEFIGDAFGAATEWYANEPAGYDTPDYVVGDGFPALQRATYDPAGTRYPPPSNCFYPGTETDEPHFAAGVGDHWFYLLAEGSSPTNGQPPSPVDCPGGNHATVTGVGIQTAIRILYTAMLMKTSNSSYPAYRLWTLQAAANLYGCYSVVFSRVRAAWDTVIVPVQPGEPQYCGPPS